MKVYQRMGIATLAIIWSIANAAPYMAVTKAEIDGQIIESIQANPIYKIGNPYVIAGIAYMPKEDYEYDAIGFGSWYGDEFHGKLTANGEIFDMDAVTAAHPTLPLPSFVEVINLENGKKIIVRVNDRGPYISGREIDLSKRAAELLGMKDAGTQKVRVRILPEESRQVAVETKKFMQDRDAKLLQQRQQLAEEQAKGSIIPIGNTIDSKYENVTGQPKGIFIQVGAYQNKEKAYETASQLSGIGSLVVSRNKNDDKDIYRLRVGPFEDINKAAEVNNYVNKKGYSDSVVVIEE